MAAVLHPNGSNPTATLEVATPGLEGTYPPLRLLVQLGGVACGNLNAEPKLARLTRLTVSGFHAPFQQPQTPFPSCLILFILVHCQNNRTSTRAPSISVVSSAAYVLIAVVAVTSRSLPSIAFSAFQDLGDHLRPSG